MEFGLSEQTCATIRKILDQHPMIKKAVIYGSRAKGNYKNGSDIDLTLMGDALDYKTLSAVAGELDESFSSRASIRFTMAMAAPGAS